MQNFVLQEPRATTPGVARVPRTWDIPVPPYDRELPREYWDSLKSTVGLSQTPKPAKTLSVPWMEIRVWAMTLLALVGFIFLIGWLITLKAPSPLVVHTDAEVAAMHAPTMVAGKQYWVDMPDKRHILINYKGTVPNFGALPTQPPGGANNAAYVDLATGNTWIWTVPVGASNIPQWIDP